ncbi:hypothetical protein SeLEV6574_g02787, partial [Synchytrium endobioticum]
LPHPTRLGENYNYVGHQNTND